MPLDPDDPRVLRFIESLNLPHGGPPDHFVDWSTFWDGDIEGEWDYEPILAKGRGHAIYASHKAGKSLLLLWLVTILATGSDGHVVVYLDYEMTADDLRERLEDMGYGPETDFTRLRYALLPSLPPLDTTEGGDALVEIIQVVMGEFPGHQIVVAIDTMGRAVAGEENSADTYRDFYRATGLRIKQMGATYVRLDHEGKDPAAGQRGSSAKGDDIDVAWRLTKTDDGLLLKRDVSRMSWVPEKVSLSMMFDPLRFEQIDMSWPEGARDTAAQMDKLGLPVKVGVRKAGKILRESGHRARQEVISAACRWRREQDEKIIL